LKLTNVQIQNILISERL